MASADRCAGDAPEHLRLVEAKPAAVHGACDADRNAGSTAAGSAGSGFMKFALVNPAWTFEGSTYFGCQEPHYPLELLFAYDKIRETGHDALLVDAQLNRLNTQEVKRRVDDFRAEFLVIPTAPSYLFWRCPPPELRVPQTWFAELGNDAVKVAIGPHSSATPAATLRKLNCDVVLRGEPDETIAQLAGMPWQEIQGCCWKDESGEHINALLAV